VAKRVKVGDKIIVDGVEYRIGEGSVQAINIWLEVLEIEPEAEAIIHLYEAKGRFADTSKSGSIPISKIKVALDKKHH